MPKTIPQPDEVSKSFWDAVDQKKLMLQYCTKDEKFQYPIRATCFDCGSADNLTWREVEGKGHILETMVVHDTRVVRRKIDVPFNVAVVSLGRSSGAARLHACHARSNRTSPSCGQCSPRSSCCVWATC